MPSEAITQTKQETALDAFRRSAGFQIMFVLHSGMEVGRAIDHLCASAEKYSAARRGWRPIDRAPKDGSWQVVARFNAEGKRLWWERAVYSLKHDSWKTYGGYCDPTHYLPLPDPPEVKE